MISSPLSLIVLFLLWTKILIASSSSVLVLSLSGSSKVEEVLPIVAKCTETTVIHATKLGTVAVYAKDAGSLLRLLETIKPYLTLEDSYEIHSQPDVPISKGWKRRRRSRRSVDDFNLSSYNTYESISEFLGTLASQNSEICEAETIGYTYEGRSIPVVRIHGKNGGDGEKVKVFIDGAQHAREWISPAVLVSMIYRLVTDYQQGDEWTVDLLDKYEFHIVPIANPDGYVYTYNGTDEEARMWRKNMKKNSTDDVNLPAACIGVDLNRNWGFHWSGDGGSQYRCSELYYGSEEFSEEETKALSQYILKHKGTWHSYFSFHSFGQMVLFPWSHTSKDNPDYSKYRDASKSLINGIQQVNINASYAYGSVGGILYAASGSSESWAYAIAGIPYAFTIELPDQRHFILPPEKILPTTTEFLSGFKSYFAHIEISDPELYDKLLNRSKPTTINTEPTVIPDQKEKTTPPMNAHCMQCHIDSKSNIYNSIAQSSASNYVTSSYIVILSYFLSLA